MMKKKFEHRETVYWVVVRVDADRLPQDRCQYDYFTEKFKKKKEAQALFDEIRSTRIYKEKLQSGDVKQHFIEDVYLESKTTTRIESFR